MVTQEQLTEALRDADRAAAVCGRFCRAGAAVEGGVYRLYHNGTGTRDTDAQVVRAGCTLGLAPDALTVRLTAWLTALHVGRCIDLNTAGG